MRRTPGGEAARKEGMKIAREMLFAVRDRVQGAYLMPPLGRHELALEVLEVLEGLKQKALGRRGLTQNAAGRARRAARWPA